MSAGTLPALIAIAGALVLAGSAMARRRLPLGRTMWLALLWVAIIASLWTAIAIGLTPR